MVIKNKIKILLILSALFLFLLLTSCIGSPTDEIQIIEIAENIEKATEEKDMDLFMENISHDYSDTNGGTYDNHINNLPEEIFSNIEENENLVDIFSMFKIEQVVTDIYATGKMEIKISLEGCIFWVACTDLYNENIEYNIDFIKEEDDWKIISMVEM